MEKAIRKIISVMIVAVTFLVSEPVAEAVGVDTPGLNPFAVRVKATKSGSCGADAVWELDELTGTLTISGSGKATSRPWNGAVIKSIIIGDEITSFSFQFYPELESVTIGKSFKEIVNNASLGYFFKSPKVSSITVHSDNPFFSSDEHRVLFNKDKTVLICYPSGNPRTDYIIPESVTTIGKTAFAYAGFLTNVTVPYGVKNIGYEAFAYCSKLSDIKIPDSVTDIDAYAFRNCESLKTITVPKGVKNIGTCAFAFCSSLSDIKVSLDNLSYSADEYGTLFTKDKTVLIKYPAGSTRPAYAVPNSVTNIGTYAFDSCKHLNTVIIPDSVKVIGNNAFYNCCYLTDVTIPGSVTKINSSAFYCCCKLGSITIPASVTSIGNAAFWNCNSLTSVLIEDGVTSIGNSSFRLCKSLKSITIPSSVTAIEYDAFRECESLADVYYMGTQDEWNKISVVGIESDEYSLNKADIHFNHEHIYSPEIIKQPTCLNDGIKTFTCVCTRGYSENISSLGHDIVIDKAVEATCTQTGLAEGQHCSRCDDATVAQKDTPTLGHDIITDKAVEATCTKTGLTEGQHCSRCDDVTVAQKETPTLGHDIITDKAVKATCTKTGLTEGQHCSRCNDVTVAQKETPTLGHDIITDKAVEATCTKTGLTEGQHCSRCNDVTVIQKTVPVKEHRYTEKYNSAKHWKECGCTLITDEQSHTFVNSNRCHCGYVRTVDITLAIKNNSGSRTINYGETLELTATVSGTAAIPENAVLIWYVDGIRKGEGNTFRVSFESGAKTVEVKLTDGNGIAYQDKSDAEISDIEEVSVNSGFFQKIISFFKNLFGINRIVTQ
ncbi:MAG: leucine-rich repeat domain-containing protein [Clostridia bacterium]|nr:leucine-rich repeat domain-containing protein [Clostridia bacterium]